jgi:protein-tyrosine-phosphatase
MGWPISSSNQLVTSNQMRERAEMSNENKKTILFVCVHNAGRSQMAAGFMRTLGGDRVEVLSAGSAPKDSINPIAVQAMAELGIDIADQQPKILTPESVQASDVVITMGCGDACPYYPGKRYEDWKLDDPAGQGIEPVRIIRDEIKGRIEALLAELF